MPRPLPIMLILFVVTLCGCVNDGDEPAMDAGLQPGDPLPEFTVQMNDGSSVSTSDLIGHASMILLFNTHCSDCAKEFPAVQEVYDQMRGDFILLCIAREEREEEIADYWLKHFLTLPYSPQADRHIFNLFAETGIPRLYIADGKGTIRYAYGPEDIPTARTLGSAIRTLRGSLR